MKLNRTFSGLTAVGLLALAAGASEPLEMQPQPASTTSTSQETATSSTIPASATQFLQRLAGEWDGQIEIRRDGSVSSSVVNISSQLQKDGKTVISCFEGYAFGEAFEGGSLLGVNPRTGQFESAWFDHVSGATMRCAAVQATDDSTFTFTGQLTGKQGRSAKVEQVVTMTDFTHYTNEWFVISENGQRTRLMFLEMTRLPEGQLSSAAEKLRSVAEQARLRGAVANVPQNGADQD